MSGIHGLPDEILLQIFRDVVHLDAQEQLHLLSANQSKPSERHARQQAFAYRGCTTTVQREKQTRGVRQLLLVCQRWMPLARAILYQGTVYLRIDSPGFIPTARSMISHAPLQMVQSLVVRWDMSKTLADLAARWEVLLNLVELMTHLEMLVLGPGPNKLRQRFQSVVSRLPVLQVVSFVARDSWSPTIITYQAPQSRLQDLPSRAELLPQLPYLSTKAENRNGSFTHTKELLDSHFLSNCTELTLKNVRCDPEGFIRMLTELAPRLRFFSYQVDHAMSDGIDRGTAGRILPMLTRVEELHFVSTTGWRNVTQFVPSQLRLAHCWPLLRHLVTSDVLLAFEELTRLSSLDVASVEYYISDTENHSSYEAFDGVISLLPIGRPGKIYLYGVPSFVRLHGDEPYIDEEDIGDDRMTFDWTYDEILDAKRKCKAREIKLRYWGKDEITDFNDGDQGEDPMRRPIPGLTP